VSFGIYEKLKSIAQDKWGENYPLWSGLEPYKGRVWNHTKGEFGTIQRAGLEPATTFLPVTFLQFLQDPSYLKVSE
jgi:hypothetical protein